MPSQEMDEVLPRLPPWIGPYVPGDLIEDWFAPAMSIVSVFFTIMARLIAWPEPLFRNIWLKIGLQSCLLKKQAQRALDADLKFLSA